jgi:nucleotide-binding universal stress UspA family protein
MYQNILVPIDGSEAAGLGLHEAIQLARTLGSRLRLLHVVDQAQWISVGAPPVTRELMVQLRSKGESLLHEAMTAVHAAGVTVEDRLGEALGDHAGEIIVAEAGDWPADLIVCGTHGRRGWKRILLGSDAEYIVRHTPVPVLLVRARDG